MKLRNKRTGEIIETVIVGHGAEWGIRNMYTDEGIQTYDSLAELNSEWEDAPEEPKKYWFINSEGEVTSMDEEYEDEEDTKATKEIGNYFLLREEAELTLRKLKAWKRLKDKGFKFSDYHIPAGEIYFNMEIPKDSLDEVAKDMSICFGGGDE